jgi:1,4-dihydroxy-2-naphthoate octaprenyltransferase
MMAKLQAFLGVARGPFLLLPVTLVASGTAAAGHAGTISIFRALLALAGLVALHASVNAFNEVSDMKTGIDLRTQRTPFSGGSGTLPSGRMRTETAYAFALAMALIGLGIGIYMWMQAGMILLPILAMGALCVLAYADILSHTGVGEIAAGLGLGLLPVMGAAIVQDGRLPASAVAAGIPAFFMTFNLLLLNEFPDVAADLTGGRKNLVILFGRRRAALIYAAAGLLTPLSILVTVAVRVLPAISLAAMAPSLFLSGPLRWALRDVEKPVPIPAMGANVTWNLLTNAVLAISMAVAAEL